VRRLILALATAVVVVSSTTSPVHAADTRGSFSVPCPFSHRLNDDPIVFPASPGVSHSHDFSGNVSADANSTYDSMILEATTCLFDQDTAAYWAPTAAKKGVVVTPIRAAAYYFGARSGDVVAFPPGMQMLAGNKDATSRAESTNVKWSCSGNGAPLTDHPYDCRPYRGRVTARVDFATCWDGLGLTPEHSAYPTAGSCPTGWTRLPQLSLRFRWSLRDPCAGRTPCTAADAPDTNIALQFASGSGANVTTAPYYTVHADFWNTWQQVSLEAMVTNCLNAHTKCGGAA
jgi:hypothetical protein